MFCEEDEYASVVETIFGATETDVLSCSGNIDNIRLESNFCIKEIES